MQRRPAELFDLHWLFSDHVAPKCALRYPSLFCLSFSPCFDANLAKQVSTLENAWLWKPVEAYFATPLVERFTWRHHGDIVIVDMVRCEERNVYEGEGDGPSYCEPPYMYV